MSEGSHHGGVSVPSFPPALLGICKHDGARPVQHSLSLIHAARRTVYGKKRGAEAQKERATQKENRVLLLLLYIFFMISHSGFLCDSQQHGGRE